jgi:hypothetical protein
MPFMQPSGCRVLLLCGQLLTCLQQRKIQESARYQTMMESITKLEKSVEVRPSTSFLRSNNRPASTQHVRGMRSG